MAAMRKKLVERRKKQMDGILEEAQLWAVLMLLPTRFVSKDSEVNRAAEGVNRTLLGDHIEKEKINRTFRKVAQKILVRGLHKDYYQESPRPVTSDLETLELSEDWRAPESVLQSIRDECCYVIERASTYTWRELKALGEGVVIFEQPLRLWLRERQLVFAGIDVGQPRHCPWTRDEEVRVRSKLCSPEPSDIWLDHSVDFVSKDFIAICADRCKSPYGWQAWMSDSNVLTLHPSFFTGTGCDSVCALRIDPIRTDPRELANVRVLTLIHETMHSKSVLWTEDHVIRINQKRLDEMEDVDWNYLFEKKGTASATSDSHQRQHPTKTDEDGHHVTEEEIHDDRYDEQDDEIYRDFVAYGLMQCMELIRRDGEDDT
ncbi:hypothetical protein OHC33_001523 [Knufia fluminis]|uniref:Uncharacterized protein n=1 Tax=Knufia fluminis TaxID=191047 RepID=A0AAN8I8B3_9EURO|nr:hypothetical protein OHC33_001523 [Knufia fluminis]